MKTLIHRYQSAPDLTQFLSQPEFDQEQILLQVFSGELDSKHLTSLLQQILNLRPHIVIIGASTSGEIYQSEVRDGDIVLAFSIFNETQLVSFYQTDLSFSAGQQLAQQALKLNARCAILFADTLQGQPQNLLEGLAQNAPDLIIAGGNAGDHNRFKHTLVIHQQHCYQQGLVGVFLINDDLIIHQDYVLNWTSIGRSMMVTRCEGSVIYELDNTPIIEVYKRYLGDEVAQSLPASIMEFPLIKNLNGLEVGRSAVAVTDEGGLVFAGSFNPGDQVRFGIADIETILHQANDKALSSAINYPIESVFIYSCTARRSFLKQHIEAELSALSQLAPTAGFFTYGEFYHHERCNELLNITTTFLTLAENKQNKVSLPELNQPHFLANVSTLRSLTHLSNVTTAELKSSLQFLEQYKIALDQTAIVSKTDPQGRITYVNQAFENITGYSAAEVMGKNHHLLRHPEMPKDVFTDLWQTIKSKKVWRGTIKNRKKNGQTYYVQSVIVPILDDQNQIVEYISIRNDVTDLIMKERMIEEQRRDKLTGLPNRRQLLIDIENHHSNQLALLDIKHFKSFNDFYGFDFADQILITFADWLKHQCYERGFSLYRISGDRFAILPEQGVNAQLFSDTLQTLKHQIHQQSFNVESAPIELDVMFGIGKGRRYQLQLAETALGQAKKRALSEAIPIEEEGVSAALEHLFWLHKLRDALNEGRIVNFYQPIVNPQDPTELKYEALVRLIERDGQVVSPFQFLDIAKKSRYYAQITRVVYQNALAVANTTGANISINLSIEDIENDEVRLYVLEQLADLKQGRITFEITESESIRDYSVMHQFILDAKTRGAQIAIDDFGSGYSNFSYLVEMQADYLKIDGSIISKILDDRNSLLVAESIIDIAKKLGIKVVAEFVSDQAIAQKLREYGVEFYQGYYFGAPGALDKPSS